MEPKSYPFHGFFDDEDAYRDMMSVASATECTGLMAAAPPSEDEVESLREIYNVPPGQRDQMLGE